MKNKSKNKISKRLLILPIMLFLILSLSLVTSITSPYSPEVEEKPSTPFKSIFYQQSVIGNDVVYVGESVSHEWSLEASYSPDKDYDDGTYSWFYGIFTILDEEGNIVYEEGPTDLGEFKSYSGSVDYSFDKTGTYYYAPAIIEVKQEHIDGNWEKVSEEIIEKEHFEVKVIKESTPQEPGEPEVSSISKFFNDIWNWIKGIFN